MIYILGSGPNGLIAANWVKNYLADKFVIIASNGNGFQHKSSDTFKFKLGQRTLFYTKDMADFFSEVDICWDRVELTKSNGVYYNGNMYDYPMQNNLSNLSLSDKLKFYWSYFNKKETKEADYIHWAISNYGKWFANHILIPHTWKTMKEDLYQVDSQLYGKKVEKLNLFKKSEICSMESADDIMMQLLGKVCDSVIKGTVSHIDVKNKTISFKEEMPRIEYNVSDTIINTISLNKFGECIDKNDILDIAFRSLHSNAMFLGVFVVPKDMVKCGYKIIYFPERSFIFSKVNITNNNKYAIITCECSIRNNELNNFESIPYREKYLERIEYDLRRCQFLDDTLFSSYHRDYSIINPAYIIPDKDYKLYNSFIHSYLEDNGIFCLGRFAEWVPWKRVEHSLDRMKQIFPDNEDAKVNFYRKIQ